MPRHFLLVAVSLASVLCGCATLGNPPAPLVRTLPTTCERLLQDQPLPAVNPTDDARLAFMKEDAALISNRSRIAAARACEADLRRAYATKGGKR